ncbi:DUF6934 family protein [Dyadobacter sediminis]|uniref:Uncharacterized protein n=1 Tax=Dyadobacter sediminis TaxID=1493691 RepID=A0A5R9K9V9_9BACT|nr:hypothetical protein [Dyadobacter sediminis]TLU91613.1 hypothetical protein FEM55_12530 [Dyadobacter sediminis]GGC01881.1 hypothetical protein GCM10011325_31290 [Dyadobacter sediminis]
MKIEKYSIKTDNDSTIFQFTSIGPKGSIEKLIQFQKIYDGVYNLAFGDKNQDTGNLDDQVISDNGDSEKVLATVVSALYKFFDAYPDSVVYAVGSSTSRTRLYRMGISKFFREVTEDFHVYGEIGDEFCDFELNKEYTSFLVRRRFS